MGNIFSEIIDWVKTKPIFWQQAIYKLLTKNEIIENDIEELVKTCKIDIGILKEYTLIVELEDLKNSLSQSSTSNIVLSKIKNVQNIKALKNGEELSFEKQGITVIYGDNGSGKSSYTGILKHVCKTRGSLPSLGRNIYDNESDNISQFAEVEYKVNNTEIKTIRFENDSISSLDLKVIDVFDTFSAHHYIEDEDEIAFLPMGLIVLEKLAKCCQRVEAKIRQKIGDYEQKRYDYSHLIDAETEVAKFLNGINYSTTLNQLRDLSKFDDNDEKTLISLVEELEKLKKLDPSKIISENNKKIARFNTLKKKYENLEKAFSKENIKKIENLIEENVSLTKALEEITKNTFSDLPVEGIGNTTWKLLWESARRFIDELRGENTFPETSENAVCPLCLQELDEEAKKRFISFEEFVKSDIQEKLQTNENKLKKAFSYYDSLDLNFEPYNPTLKEIYDVFKDFEISHNKFVKIIDANKQNIKIAITKTDINKLKELMQVEELSNLLSRLVKKIEEENEKLEKQKVEDVIQKLERQITELKARKKLKKYKPKIESEISRIKKIHLLKEALKKCNTKSITIFSNQLSKKYVTDNLQDNFKKELQKFGFNYVKIKPEIRGERGKQYFYLRLDENYNTSIGLKDILSEGEHRAISLATFFSELSIAEHKSTIVFDDPVSSLDHKWRNRIAKRIVEEANNRQVIIFTHDITFLMMLQEHANRSSVPLSIKSLTRKLTETGIIADNPPWDALNVKRRIGILKNDLQKLEKISKNETEEKYKDEVKKFYGKLRETWERIVEELILNNTVTRFGRTIQTQRLKKVVDLTEDDYNKIEVNMSKASTYFWGHDTAGELIEEYPNIDEVKNDISLLEIYVKELRKRRN